jgi:RIO kinase 3
VTGVKSKEDLFFEITKLDPLTHNTTMLERIHMKGQPVHVLTNAQGNDEEPDEFKPLEYPFEYAWKKVEKLKHKKKAIENVTA